MRRAENATTCLCIFRMRVCSVLFLVFLTGRFEVIFTGRRSLCGNGDDLFRDDTSRRRAIELT